MNLEKLRKHLEKHLSDVFEIVFKQNAHLRVVGGVVRDYLLFGTISHDVDIEICFNRNGDFDKNWDGLKKSLEDKFQIEELAYKILSFSVGDYQIELSPIRVEEFNRENSHKNFDAKYFSKLDASESFKRRDITINAMAIEVSRSDTKFIDPFNGKEDLENRVIELCDEENFIKDPVRFLRSYRFMSSLNFQFGQTIEHSLQQMDLTGLSVSFFLSEMKKSHDYKFFLNSCLSSWNFLLWFRSKGVIKAKEVMFNDVNAYANRLVKADQRFDLIFPLCFECVEELFIETFQMQKSQFEAAEMMSAFLNKFNDSVLSVLSLDDFEETIIDDNFVELFEAFTTITRHPWLIDVLGKDLRDLKALFRKYLDYKVGVDLALFNNHFKKYVKFYSFLQDHLC